MCFFDSSDTNLFNSACQLISTFFLEHEQCQNKLLAYSKKRPKILQLFLQQGLNLRFVHNKHGSLCDQESRQPVGSVFQNNYVSKNARTLKEFSSSQSQTFSFEEIEMILLRIGTEPRFGSSESAKLPDYGVPIFPFNCSIVKYKRCC